MPLCKYGLTSSQKDRKLEENRRLTFTIVILYNPAMQGAERNISIQDYGNEFTSPDRKYAFQIGLKDLDFDVNYMMIKAIGLSYPFSGIEQAEDALIKRAVTPSTFREMDETTHAVLIFDPRPIAYSGFLSCVRHSLAMTDQGIFEIGRYQGISMTSTNKYWQWFIHRRLASKDQASQWMEDEETDSNQLMDQIYQLYLNQ